MYDKKNEILQEIQEADKILVGIGYEFRINHRQGLKNLTSENRDWIENYHFAYQMQNDNVGYVKDMISAYHMLGKLLVQRDYFIVNLAEDGLIYRAALEDTRIVSPCGNLNYLQCSSCCGQPLLESRSIVKKVIEQEVKVQPICPACGSLLQFNWKVINNYDETGYISQWNSYKKWLQGTLNRKLLVLELGVGMEYPNVIRWPFEKIVYYNQKAKIYCIHHKLCQMTEELNGKGCSIKANAVEYMRNTFV